MNVYNRWYATLVVRLFPSAPSSLKSFSNHVWLYQALASIAARKAGRLLSKWNMLVVFGSVQLSGHPQCSNYWGISEGGKYEWFNYCSRWKTLSGFTAHKWKHLGGKGRIRMGVTGRACAEEIQVRPQEVAWPLPSDDRYCFIMTFRWNIKVNASMPIKSCYSLALSVILEQWKYLPTDSCVVHSCSI